MVKKRTVRKSKKNNNSAYFEYKSGNSRKIMEKQILNMIN